MRKVLSLLMSIIMLVSCVGSIQLSACAADYTTMATDLPLNGQWSGDCWITETNREQWFRVTIPSDGKYSFKTMSYKDRTGIIFYNYDLSKEIIGDWYRYTNGTNVSPSTRSYNCILSAGTYYIKVGGDTGRYKLTGSFSSYNATDAGAISYDNPFYLPINYEVTGAITETDTEDWYMISVPADKPYVIKCTSYKDRAAFVLFNYDLSKEIIGDWYRYTNGTEVSPVTRTYNCVLSAGTYYIKTGGDKGKYMLSWYQLTPENCSHEFENKTVSSTYTTQGYTLHTCKICGYSYTDNYTAKLKVNVPAVSNLKKGKKKITVYISNAYNIDGIQISYSTSKKFAKSKTKTLSTKKTAKTLSKLKNKKKYYVKVRGYKIVNGKKVYSSWSKVKSVKTK